MAESLEAQTILDPIPGPGPMVRGVLSEYYEPKVEHFTRAPVKDLGVDLPYHPKLVKRGSAEAPEYFVTVTKGTVGEFGAGDSVVYHTASEHYSGNTLTEFPATGSVCLVVQINKNGNIGSPEPKPGEDPIPEVQLAVGVQAGGAVKHYIPRVGPSPGVAGVLVILLAEIVSGEGSAPTIVHYLSKSNLFYTPDLPAILSTTAAASGVGVIPKEWDNTAKAYKLRALTSGTGQLGITTGTDTIEIRGNGANQELSYTVGGGSPTVFARFVDGLFTSGYDFDIPAGGGGGYEPIVIADPAGQLTVSSSVDAGITTYSIRGNDTNGSIRYRIGDGSLTGMISWEDGLVTTGYEGPLDINIPTVIPRTVSAQINVTEQAGDGTVYLVEGNGKDGSLTYTVDGGSAIDLIAWQDGLVTSYSSINIPITTGGSGLPTGYLGDMLYFDGAEWTRLEAPSAPASGTVNLLTHDGTAPAWVTKDIANISVCDGGSPATWQIIKWGVVIP